MFNFRSRLTNKANIRRRISDNAMPAALYEL